MDLQPLRGQIESKIGKELTGGRMVRKVVAINKNNLRHGSRLLTHRGFACGATGIYLVWRQVFGSHGSQGKYRSLTDTNAGTDCTSRRYPCLIFDSYRLG